MRLRSALPFALLLALPNAMQAQSAIDSAHVRATVPALDTIATALARYCATNRPRGYVCDARASLATLQRAESLLVVQVGSVSDSVPTSEPPDTSQDSTVVVVPPPAPDTSSEIAELPRVVPDFPYPTGGSAVKVPAGTNLQAVLNQAKPGDVILLAPCATFTGNFVLPVIAGASDSGWVTVRTDASLGAEGTRETPSDAGTRCLGKIVTPNPSSTILMIASVRCNSMMMFGSR